MYISEKLNENEKKEFKEYLSSVVERIKLVNISTIKSKAKYKGEFRDIVSKKFRVEEYFKSEEDFNKSGRRPLDDGYEKENVVRFKDGTLCVKSLMELSFSSDEINSDLRLIVAFLNYPMVRKYAPNILSECIDESVQEYQKADDLGMFLSTYEGLLFFKKEMEKNAIKAKEQGVSQIE